MEPLAVQIPVSPRPLWSPALGGPGGQGLASVGHCSNWKARGNLISTTWGHRAPRVRHLGHLSASLGYHSSREVPRVAGVRSWRGQSCSDSRPLQENNSVVSAGCSRWSLRSSPETLKSPCPLGLPRCCSALLGFLQPTMHPITWSRAGSELRSGWARPCCKQVPGKAMQKQASPEPSKAEGAEPPLAGTAASRAVHVHVCMALGSVPSVQSWNTSAVYLGFLDDILPTATRLKFSGLGREIR